MHDATPLQFPTLNLSLNGAWEWPLPPFPWTYSARQTDAAMQACLVETRDGLVVEATLVDMDSLSGVLKCMPKGRDQTVSLPISRLARLTLTTPLLPATPSAGAPVERIPAPSEERNYELRSTDAQAAPLSGRTLGHVATDEGLYLFAPVDEPRALLRVFVPRSAYSTCAFGPSIRETAAALWIVDRTQLLDAIDRQEQMPVLPMGQSLLELGLITKTQLERALAEKPEGVALGEALVAKKLITRPDLWAALAHKMRYPLVDLDRFEIDSPASMKWMLHLALKSGALPLMVDKDRLIVAVDRPDNAVKLRNLSTASQMQVVPVFATQLAIVTTLSRLSKKDIWSQHIATSMEYFESTT